MDEQNVIILTGHIDAKFHVEQIAKHIRMRHFMFSVVRVRIVPPVCPM